MDEEVIRNLLLIMGSGAILQGLSHRFPIPFYERQTIAVTDYLLMLVFLFFLYVYDDMVEPFIGENSYHFLPVEYFNSLANHIPPLGQLFCYLLLSDFLVYFSHRLAHSRYFWSAHALHHAPLHVNWITGMFGSPGHYLLIMVPYTLAAGFVLTHMTQELIFTLLLIEIFYQNFIHTNIRLPFSKYLEYIIVTPRVHMGHHHDIAAHNRSNFGLMFTFWDRLFGTYTNPENYSGHEKFGIGYSPNKFALLLGFFASKEKRPSLDQ